MGYTSQPDQIFTMPQRIGPMWENFQPLTWRRQNREFGIIQFGGRPTHYQKLKTLSAALN
jgi:hypothetical protein